MLKETIKWMKYCAIIINSTITHRTVVSMFGNTYVVYGNVVQKVTN